MHNNFFAAEYLITKLLLKLLVCATPVIAGSNQQSYVYVRIAYAEGLQHWRQYIPARHRSGMVAYYYGAVLFAYGEAFQPPGTYGSRHGLPDYGCTAASFIQLSYSGLQHRGKLQCAWYAGIPVGYFYAVISNSP